MPYRIIAALFVLAAGTAVASEPAQRNLTFEDRLAAQKAIEQVYWNHRIWPKENVQPKPSLAEVMPDSAIRAKVEDALRLSSALSSYWGRPMTAVQLQAEMSRMARDSKDPSLLHEVFEALHNDPLLIAETLARQTLAEHLARNWYARDERFHGRLKQKIQRMLLGGSSIDQLVRSGGNSSELTLVHEATTSEPSFPQSSPSQITVDTADWEKAVERVSSAFPVPGHAGRRGIPQRVHPSARIAEMLDRILVGQLSDLVEDDDSFSVLLVTDKAQDRLRLRTIRWTKDRLDSLMRSVVDVTIPHTSYRYPFVTPKLPDDGGCRKDSWKPTSPNLPDTRDSAVAVWNGTEMIIIGGFDGGGAARGGRRYRPATDSWTGVSLDNAPLPGGFPSAVWTGTQLIVWGGTALGSATNIGGRYDPTQDVWSATSGIGAPTPRFWHSAVWTGTEMIVWGGFDFQTWLRTGSRYDPKTDSWRQIAAAGAPSARGEHTAVWTGSEMIVWGGQPFPENQPRDGGRYDPAADRWESVPDPGPNVGQVWHTAVWTGTEMIVWGGASSSTTSIGARYSPSRGTWTLLGTVGAPEMRQLHSAVWTGTEMIVWGGQNGNGSLNTGGRYDPASDTWASTNVARAPVARDSHLAIWTGAEMIVWGGDVGGLSAISGGRYNPNTDSWVPTSTGEQPSPRYGSAAVWTGSEMIVWGGWDGGQYAVNTGGRYDPATDSWRPTATDAAPLGRQSPAVWTGTEMIVWGGTSDRSGGRYNPATDSWTPTNTIYAPPPRGGHTAVWTGTEMIVWGGVWGGYGLNTGGRYSPLSDSWTSTTQVNAPEGRGSHTAVWTGAEMVVWGGSYSVNFNYFYLDTGGRYVPALDRWYPTSRVNAPDRRQGHAAIWTGNEMIVWGGGNSSGWTPIGGRYDPSTDSWLQLSAIANPSPRSSPSAVWTGSEMVIWGGTIGRTGARYDPIADAWQPTNADNAPSERWGHATVWTGKEMIVWSGLPWPPTSTGGRYCDCADPISVFRDDDGDGLGDSALSVEWCGTAPPPGFSLEAGDNCPATIVTPTVVIASCNSGVRNYMFPDGCNFGDGIAQCRANAGNHGQFVSCVAHRVDTWKGAGLVTGQQGSRIVRCATQ